MHRSLCWPCTLLALAAPGACTTDRADAPLGPDYARTTEGGPEQVVFEFHGSQNMGQTFSSGFRNDTTTRVLVTVIRSGDSTVLSYDVNKCPSPFVSCFSVERGFGLIPGSDLTAMGNGTLRLHTNTAARENPAFQRSAGAGGEIGVTWVPELGGQFQEQSGMSTLMRGPEFTRTTGHLFSTSAIASGTVVGTDVNQGSRQAFTSSRAGMTIQIIRSQ